MVLHLNTDRVDIVVKRHIKAERVERLNVTALVLAVVEPCFDDFLLVSLLPGARGCKVDGGLPSGV